MVRFIYLKYMLDGLFDQTEGHWKCQKHAVMLGCVCKALLREEGATHLQNGEKIDYNIIVLQH